MPDTTRTTSPRRRARALVALLCAGLLAGSPGCATLTGMITGAFTGAVDAPAQIYRHNRAHMDRHPEFWVWNILVFVPIGIAAGPLAGLSKGVALDIQWLLDLVTYDKAFTTYREPSIWRPYTIHW